MKKNNLSNVGDWRGRKAVDSSVILAYERSAALKEDFEVNFQGKRMNCERVEGNDYNISSDLDGDGVDDRLVFFTRILSIAKLCDNNYSPTHIFWLTRAAKYFPEPNSGMEAIFRFHRLSGTTNARFV